MYIYIMSYYIQLTYYVLYIYVCVCAHVYMPHGTALQESKQVTFEAAHLIGLHFGCRFRITCAKSVQKHFGEQYARDALYGWEDGPIVGARLIFSNHRLGFGNSNYSEWDLYIHIIYHHQYFSGIFSLSIYIYSALYIYSS
jgi:hypothetical protein